VEWPTHPAVLVAVAFVVATIGSSVGHGGGLLLVPYLISVAAFRHPVATATSLVAVGVSAVAASAAYARQKRIDTAAAVAFSAAAIPGALLGAWLADRVDRSTFVYLFGALLAVSTLSVLLMPKAEAARKRRISEGPLVLKRTYTDLGGEEVPYGVDLRFGVPAALAGGVLGAFFGVGGGILMVPVLYIVLGVPFRIAAPTSTAVMVPMSIVAIAAHVRQGHTPDAAAGFLAAGALAGGYAAAVVTRRVPGYVLRWMMALLLVSAGTLAVIRELNGGVIR
jgi:hypothetical protein